MPNCGICKASDCHNPQHLEKAYKPEEDAGASKVVNMSKSLTKQMEDFSFAKALNARAASALAKDAQYKEYYTANERPVRHLGELVATKVHIEPVVQAVSKGIDYSSCGNCGIIHKSLVDCPRCTANSKITEVKDWRVR